MDQAHAITVLESLASGLRLEVFRLLMRQSAQGMVAGEISSTLNIPPTNLSFHLKNLTHAGLVMVEQEGRFQRYRANMPLMLDLVAYLTDECCGGDVGQCRDLPGGSAGYAGIVPAQSPPRAGAGS